MFTRQLPYIVIPYFLITSLFGYASEEDSFSIQIKARHTYFPKLVCAMANFNSSDKVNAQSALAPQILASAKLSGECGINIDIDGAQAILTSQGDVDSITISGEAYVVYQGKAEEGLNLLKKAAMLGSKVALKDLDVLYSGGGVKFGIPLNVAEALKWKSLRFSLSNDKRATLYENGTPDKLDLSERELGRAEGFAQALASSDPSLLPKIAQEAKVLESEVLQARDSLFVKDVN